MRAKCHAVLQVYDSKYEKELQAFVRQLNSQQRQPEQ